MSIAAVAVAACSKQAHDTAGPGKPTANVAFWLTTGDRSSQLARSVVPFSEPRATDDVITVDRGQQFQTIDGFGFALTGGSAQLIHKMDPAQRDALLRELFLTSDAGIGISYLRISIGASDLDDHVFSYASRREAGFSLDEDRKDLIPVLKAIVALQPGIKIMGTPWSPPAWMKTNNNAKAGSLKPEYYDAYAKYFVSYIQEMKKEAITIDAVTVQNEPENPGNTPSMIMTAAEQAAFVKTSLGPAFKAAGIQTKIVVFDHNCDHPEYPIAVLNDAAAKPFIDGSAFHLYLGEIDALSKVRDAHPDKNIYFTEQWTGGDEKFADNLIWHVEHLVIGATRNWARNVLEWNLAADAHYGPHTDDGGCTSCMGALTLGNGVQRNVSYYIIAHASKFVPPGSTRIASNALAGVPNVAFLVPGGNTVLIAVNTGAAARSFAVKAGDKTFRAALPPGAVGTWVW